VLQPITAPRVETDFLSIPEIKSKSKFKHQVEKMKKRTLKKDPIQRAPYARPTKKHKDESKYDRKKEKINEQ